MKNTLLFIYSTNILVRLLTIYKYEELSYPQKSENVRPHSTKCDPIIVNQVPESIQS